MVQKFIERVGNDLNMPTETFEQQEAILTSLKDHLTSWRIKSGLPKKSRWFSWLEAGNIQIKEWWSSRMVLQWYIGPTAPDPDSQSVAKFKELRSKGAGALSLALQCLSQQHWEYCSIMIVAGKPLWDYYTFQCRHVTCATDNVGFAMEMEKSWWKCDQLVGLATLASPIGRDRWLNVARWSEDEQNMGKTALQYVTSLLSERTSSLAKHSVAPFAYASLLDEWDIGSQTQCLQKMKTDWKLLLKLEESDGTAFGSLCEDLRLTLDTPTRLLMTCLEVVKFRSAPAEALQILRGMVEVVPDSKVIEDIHQRLRVLARSRPNERVSDACIQQTVNQCNVLDARNVKHDVSINRETFLSKLRTTRSSYNSKKLSNPRDHKLPKHYGSILKPSHQMMAISEPNLLRSAAGWAWLRHYSENRLGSEAFVSLKVGSDFLINWLLV